MVLLKFSNNFHLHSWQSLMRESEQFLITHYLILLIDSELFKQRDKSNWIFNTVPKDMECISILHCDIDESRFIALVWLLPRCSKIENFKKFHKISNVKLRKFSLVSMHFLFWATLVVKLSRHLFMIKAFSEAHWYITYAFKWECAQSHVAHTLINFSFSAKYSNIL